MHELYIYVLVKNNIINDMFDLDSKVMLGYVGSKPYVRI